MCTIAVLVNVVAGSKVVIAANRDEMYARDARAPERLADGVVGGVDVLSGGTWLALRRDGAFVAVTNQRALAPQVANVRSRGLVVKELAQSSTMDDDVARLDPRDYASMNLVWAPPGERPRIAYLRHNGDRETVELSDGIHVLCNDKLGSPGFPRGERLATALAAMRDPTWDQIAPHLGDHTHAAPTLVDHLPIELARELTATCIHTPAYGTRSSTIAYLGTDRVLAYRHADGSPCVTPFLDGMELFA